MPEGKRFKVERRLYEVLIEEGMVESSTDKCFYVADSLDGLELVMELGEEFDVDVSGEDLKGLIDGGVIHVSSIVDYLVKSGVVVE